MAVKSRRGKKKKIRVTAGNIRNAGSTWRDTEEKEKGKVRVTAGNIRNSGSSQRQAGGRPKKEPESGGAWVTAGSIHNAGSTWRTENGGRQAEAARTEQESGKNEPRSAGILSYSPLEVMTSWREKEKTTKDAEEPSQKSWSAAAQLPAAPGSYLPGAARDQTAAMKNMTEGIAAGQSGNKPQNSGKQPAGSVWVTAGNIGNAGKSRRMPGNAEKRGKQSGGQAQEPGLYEKWYVAEQNYRAFNEQLDEQIAAQEKELKPGYTVYRPTEEEREQWFREAMEEAGLEDYLAAGMPDYSDEGYLDYAAQANSLKEDWAKLDEYDRVAGQEREERKNEEPEWWEYFALPTRTAYKYWKNGQPEDAYTRAQSYIRQDQRVKDLEAELEALEAQIREAPAGTKERLEEEKDEVSGQLDMRRAQLTQYAQERVAGEYEQIAQDADFAELAAAGAAKGGKLEAVRENPVGNALLSADAALYGAMTQEEQDIYHAHLARGGEQEANAYFESIRERLSGRTAAFGEDMLEKIGSDEAFEKTGLPEFMKPVQQSIVQTAKGAASFLAGGTEAVQGLGQTARMAFLGEEAPLPQSYLQKAQQLFREDMEGVEAVVNDILYGIGEMLPAVAAGVATGGAGAPAAVSSAVSSLMTAGTSFGSTYSQARREGKEAGEAASYALLTAASEAALQYGLSGVKAIGGSALSRTLGKKLDGALGKLASGNLGQRFAGMALKNIGQNGGEFAEEYLQSVMTPFLRNVAFGENNEVSLLSEEALYDGMVGYLTSMVMNVPYVAGRRGAGDGEAALAIADAQRIMGSEQGTLTPQERTLCSGLLEAVETGKIRPEVREALPVSENDRIAAAQVRIWAENGRLNETIGLEQDIGTLAAQEQALCREVQEAVESGRVTAELREKLGLPGNERVAAGLLRTWAQDGTIARLIEDVQAGQARGELERRGGITFDNDFDNDIMMAEDFTIQNRNHTDGNPNAVAILGADLNNRQKILLERLPEYDSRIIVKKNDVSMTDLAALTAKTGDEFAVFTRGSQRLVIRGDSRSVNINEKMALELAQQGYKWSGHTHPGMNGNCLFASEGDRLILKCFGQDVAYIYNSKGEYSDFGKE